MSRRVEQNTVFTLGPRVIFDAVVNENPYAWAEIHQDIQFDIQRIKDEILGALRILIDADKNRIGHDVNVRKGISGAIYEDLFKYLNDIARSDLLPVIRSRNHENHLHMAFQRNVMGLEILIPPRAKMAVQIDYLARYYLDTGATEKRVTGHVRNFIKDSVLTKLEK